MSDVAVGLSLMPTEDFLRATLPLFETNAVDVVEWSFDTAWTDEELPSWMPPLLDDYAEAGRLLGHGIAYSPLSARFTARQDDWLRRLRVAFDRRAYRSVSEHFGFMTASDFEFGAPMPVPYTDSTVRIGRDRLRRLKEAARVDVGLENLALALGTRDVDDQGPFLEELLSAVDGFLVLDVHNLYCQASNFGRDALALAERYPLARVRQLHVSGGSWSGDGALRIRQDTHDDRVPDEVLALVAPIAARCPNLAHVILERVGGTLRDAAEEAAFAEDFRVLRKIVREG